MAATTIRLVISSYPRRKRLCNEATGKAAPDLEESLANLVATGAGLQEVPFPVVISGTTGKQVMPVDASDPVSAEIIEAIGRAVAAGIVRLNQEDSPVRKLRRINEASRFFEDELLGELNSMSGFACEIPSTAGGGAQRSGYPDLKLTHQQSGRIAYLDPKLFEQGSRDSTFRSFYYEPKGETNKVLDDAHHLLIGIAHDGNDGDWRFVGWHLVDLSRLAIRFKPEFQASNRDLYREGAILASDAEQSDN